MDKKIIGLAVDNISKFGDTDIFPYPIEKLIFYDKRDEVINYIHDLHAKFYNVLPQNPPININTACPLGYNSFRWATQIDPFWNGYFLSLVLSIAEKIESSRIPVTQKVVYSYRYSPDYSSKSLFDREYNWIKFQQDSLELARTNENIQYVVICDIADFYSRIYHHPLENALQRLGAEKDTVSKLKKLLQKFSNTKSYGLPIGGQAARILAELALNTNDKLLVANGINFKRYVDDMHIFCSSIEDAHRALNFIANRLMRNEGLSLQKHKTQIQSKAEFEKLVASRINAESDTVKEKNRAKFMSLPVNYDPYSDTADTDYVRIKKDLETFDIVGLLNEELKKVRIHQQFGRHLIKAFDVLDISVISNAFVSICEKLELLYPIFPALMTSAYKNFSRLDPNTQEILSKKLRELGKTRSYIVQSELHMSYMLRVIGLNNTVENEEFVNWVYVNHQDSALLRSLVFQIMTRWKAYYWLTDRKDSFLYMSKWERRIFILASCYLGDEGEHWQNHNKREFTDSEKIILEWGVEKAKIETWQLPL